jgi:hypothetical protein
MHTRIYGSLLLFCCLCISCTDDKNTNAGKPIVLGDPSTIVTETDSQYLRDFVAEVKPAPQPEEPKQDTVATQHATQEQTQPKEEERSTTSPKEENGLTVDFEEVTIFIPRIDVREPNSRSKNKNGATYQLREGELERNQVRVIQGTVTKISQRIQGVTTAKTSMGTLQLGATNTNWQPLTGRNNTYLIGSLNASADKQTPAAIRNAAMRAVRSKRMGRAQKQKWEAAAQRIRPRDVSTSARSVIWKIEGKDARGRNYQKQVRVDIP